VVLLIVGRIPVSLRILRGVRRERFAHDLCASVGLLLRVRRVWPRPANNERRRTVEVHQKLSEESRLAREQIESGYTVKHQRRATFACSATSPAPRGRSTSIRPVVHPGIIGPVNPPSWRVFDREAVPNRGRAGVDTRSSWRGSGSVKAYECGVHPHVSADCEWHTV
jgi:hypothetical protein